MDRSVGTLVFYLGLGFLFTHELDAMTHQEWKLLYVLRSLPSEQARDWFVWLHVPLFGFLIWITHHPKLRVRTLCRALVAVFFVIHALLHYRLSDHPLYTFSGMTSNALIYGGALCGLVFLLFLWTVRRDAARS